MLRGSVSGLFASTSLSIYPSVAWVNQSPLSLPPANIFVSNLYVIDFVVDFIDLNFINQQTLLLLVTVLSLTTHFFPFQFPTVSLARSNPWEGLAAHCKDAQPIPAAEFLERQRHLAHALHALNGSAYVAEPGASALFFGNISDAAWHLSERPLLLIISPLADRGEVSAQVTILTPAFEADRAMLLDVAGVDVTYVAWQEDDDPYAVAVAALPTSSRGPIYVDGMTRHFIVDGFAKAAPGLGVLSAPLGITSLRERKSSSEIALLKCVNEVCHVRRSCPADSLHFER